MSDPTTSLPSALTLDAWLSQISTWVAAREYDQAIRRCGELLTVYPDAVRVIRIQAGTFESAGDLVQAAAAYRRVLDILPADEGALLGLARCLAAGGQTRESALLALQVLDYDPRNVEALRIEGGAAQNDGMISRARSLMRAGLMHRAIALMRRMNEAEPDRTDVQVLLAEMFWHSGLPVTTVGLCQAIVDKLPDCLNAHVILSTVWAQAGSPDLSALHRHAVECVDPDFRQTHAWLGDRSPFPVSDVLTQPGSATPPAPVSESGGATAPGNAQPEDEHAQASWVDELMAAAGPVMPSAGAPETGQLVQAGIRESELDMYAGAIAGAGDVAPLEWTPAQNDESAAASDATDDGLPDWMRDLQLRAAQHSSTEVTDAPADAIHRDWAPASGNKAPEEQSPGVFTPGARASGAGTPDVGMQDAGMQDAGIPDAGKPDAGKPDVGTPDSNTLEATSPSVQAVVDLPPGTEASPRGAVSDEQPVMPELSAPREAPVVAADDAVAAIPAMEAEGAPVVTPPTGSSQTPVESSPAAEEANEVAAASESESQATELSAAALPGAGARRKPRGRRVKVKPLSDEKLALARKALEAGRYDEAAGHYAALITAGKKLDVVLADLDVAVHAYPDRQRFHALLGDIYTRKGDVNAALAEYHRALENV